MDAILDRKGLSVSDIVGGYSQGVQGKGDRPRSWGKNYADNYDLIDWSKKTSEVSYPVEIDGVKTPKLIDAEDRLATPSPETPCRSDG